MFESAPIDVINYLTLHNVIVSTPAQIRFIMLFNTTKMLIDISDHKFFV
jgi:hypothetical protein